jgi:hypothetical protein
MVPKRSKTPGSGTLGSAARRQRRSRPSSNVTSWPRQANELTPPAESDVSNDAPAAPAEDPTARPSSAADVTGAIEHERVELLQIQAMLKCLYEVLLYADDDDSVMHADVVANVCARLINEYVGRLDQLLMQGFARDSRDELDDSAVNESPGSEEG